jgi:hypothetical protein
MAPRSFIITDNGLKLTVIDEFNYGRTVAWFDRRMKLGFIELTIGSLEYKREGNWKNAVIKRFPNLKEG